MPPPGTDKTERWEYTAQRSILPGGVMTPPYIFYAAPRYSSRHSPESFISRDTSVPT